MFSDADLWAVIEMCGLGQHFSQNTTSSSASSDGEATSGRGGLDFKVLSNGDNISMGQKQLLCLARVMLLSPRILIIDEGMFMSFVHPGISNKLQQEEGQ